MLAICLCDDEYSAAHAREARAVMRARAAPRARLAMRVRYAARRVALCFV